MWVTVLVRREGDGRPGLSIVQTTTRDQGMSVVFWEESQGRGAGDFVRR